MTKTRKLTDKAMLQKLDRKIGAGKATRAQILQAIDLKRKISAARQSA